MFYIVCIALSIFFLIGIWGMQEMPQRSIRPPQHPPGWKNVKRRKQERRK